MILFEHVLVFLFPGNVGPPSTLLATAADRHPWPLLMPDANTVALYTTVAAAAGDMKEGAAGRGAGGAVGRRGGGGIVAAPSATRVAAASHGTTRVAAAGCYS